MPQLDLNNWFFVIFLLVIFVFSSLVLFIKYYFYHWKKVYCLKDLFTTLKFLRSNINFFKLILKYLKLICLFLKNKLNFFKNLVLISSSCDKSLNTFNSKFFH